MVSTSGKPCSSCGKLTSSYVEFKCPKCTEFTFTRCYSCREKHIQYKCPKCAFQGP